MRLGSRSATDALLAKEPTTILGNPVLPLAPRSVTPTVFGLHLQDPGAITRPVLCRSSDEPINSSLPVSKPPGLTSTEGVSASPAPHGCLCLYGAVKQTGRSASLQLPLLHVAPAGTERVRAHGMGMVQGVRAMMSTRQRLGLAAQLCGCPSTRSHVSKRRDTRMRGRTDLWVCNGTQLGPPQPWHD